MTAAADDTIDFQFLTYALTLRCGAAALASLWNCHEITVHQILNEDLGTAAIHDGVVEIVQHLGASEIAQRAGVTLADVLNVLDYGEGSESLVRFIGRHPALPPSYIYTNAAAQAALN
jgi:hypothetical protein